MERRPPVRGIDPAEIRRVQRSLSGPDPAGLLGPVRYDDVARVAAYMNPYREGFIHWSPIWGFLVDGHPAARAIYYHELTEITELERLGQDDPDNLDRRGTTYFAAHAWACWEEARYWEAWAHAEGKQVSAAAFLLVHPWRRSAEIRDVREQLHARGASVAEPGRVESERARAFYAAHGMEPG